MPRSDRVPQKKFVPTRIRLAIMMLCAALFMSGLSPSRTMAVQPDEVLADAALEARARTLSHGLRCLVCQNQSIDDSDAPLARDLRLLVRERLVAGDSDAQVMDFLVARFGDFVLLRPPLKGSTLLLWLMPLMLLAAGTAVAMRQIRSQTRRGTGASMGTKLTTEEERALAELIETPSQAAAPRPSPGIVP